MLKTRNNHRMLTKGLSLLGLVGIFGCNALSGASDLTIGTDTTSHDLAETSAGTIPDSKKSADAPSTNPGSPTAPTSKTTGTTGSGGGNVDAGLPPPPTTTDNPIECGSVTCSGNDAICCVRDTKTCTTKSAGCAGVPVECGGRSNCDQGEICCLTIVNNGGSAQCSAESACGGGNQVIFCRTAADCLAGQKCVPTGGSFTDHHACI